GSEQGHDLLELQRRIRGVAELHVVDWACDREHDATTLRSCLERHVESRVDADGIEEGNRTGIDTILRTEEHEFSLSNRYSSQDTRTRRSTEDLQVRFDLEILRERCLNRRS